MNKKLLEILVSPISKTPLIYHKDKNELWSQVDQLAFPIKEGIPIMLVEDARRLTAEELDGIKS